MAKLDVRKGMPSVELSREEFERRYRSRFADPAFEPLQRELDAIVAAAWDGYANSRKAPRTRRAGPGFADPDYELSADWLAARDAILAAQRRHDDVEASPRILLINGSSRSEHTCPGEMSKSWRLVKLAEPIFEKLGFAVDILDLSRLTSEFGKQVHPCKSCVSTAMPLCHWPCSCYPNHALGQTDDWMNEIYPMWVAAHGIMIVAPVNWYHAPTGLKAMIDRLVCADGGNPDPTLTHGKDAKKAKEIELRGWDYPRHLSGRLYSVIVHGDVEGAEMVQNELVNWLNFMDLEPAGTKAVLNRYIGYWEPYANNHVEFDQDLAMQGEVRNAAQTLAEAVVARREGRMVRAGQDLHPPRQK